MKIYLTGPENIENYQELIEVAEVNLVAEGHLVLTPLMIPKSLDHESKKRIRNALIESCEGIAFLKECKGVDDKDLKDDYAYAKSKHMLVKTGV